MGGIGPLTVSQEEASEIFEVLEVKAAQAEAEYRKLLRQAQAAGGATEKLQAPGVFAAIVKALRGNPDLTPRQFFDSIGPDDEGSLYKSCDQERREVVRQAGEGRAVTFPTLERYFTKARKR